MDPDKHLTEIERFPVVEEEARRFCSNRPFFEMGLGLLSETTELAWLCSLIRRSAAWQVNKAIVGGNTVRLVKLSRSLLQATRDHQAELGWVVMRMLVETAVNVRFLVQEDSEELFRAYLDYSLAHEIKLEHEIRCNVEERGQELPIETRMLKSIALTYRKSGGKPSQVVGRRERKWGRLSTKEKAKRLGIEDLYDTVYASPSRNVHGAWQDLLQHHLDWREELGGFTPDYTTTSVRPQLLFVAPLFVISAVRDHLAFMGIEPWPELASRLTDLEGRVELGDRLHEDFLQERDGKRA